MSAEKRDLSTVRSERHVVGWLAVDMYGVYCNQERDGRKGRERQDLEREYDGDRGAQSSACTARKSDGLAPAAGHPPSSWHSRTCDAAETLQSAEHQRSAGARRLLRPAVPSNGVRARVLRASLQRAGIGGVSSLTVARVACGIRRVHPLIPAGHNSVQDIGTKKTTPGRKGVRNRHTQHAQHNLTRREAVSNLQPYTGHSAAAMATSRPQSPPRVGARIPLGLGCTALCGPTHF